MHTTVSVPSGAQFKCKEGDLIKYTDTLFVTHKRVEQKINLAKKLGIDPDSIFRYLTKVIGEKVSEGDVLAKKKRLVGHRKIASPFSGVLSYIDHNTGIISIATETDSKVGSKSPVKREYARMSGKVIKIQNNKITIEIEKAEEYSLESADSDMRAKTFYFDTDTLYFTLSQDDVEGKITLAPQLKTSVVAKCEALGCVGFVTAKKPVDSKSASAQLKDKHDMDTILQRGRKLCIVSQAQKKLILYD